MLSLQVCRVELLTDGNEKGINESWNCEFSFVLASRKQKWKVSISILKTHHMEMLCRYLSNTLFFYFNASDSSHKSSKLTSKPTFFLLKSRQQWFHVPLVLCCDSCCCSGPDLDTHCTVLKQAYPVCTSMKTTYRPIRLEGVYQTV